jgi:hypothetical protein
MSGPADGVADGAAEGVAEGVVVAGGSEERVVVAGCVVVAGGSEERVVVAGGVVVVAGCVVVAGGSEERVVVAGCVVVAGGSEERVVVAGGVVVVAGGSVEVASCVVEEEMIAGLGPSSSVMLTVAVVLEPSLTPVWPPATARETSRVSGSSMSRSSSIVRSTDVWATPAGMSTARDREM